MAKKLRKRFIIIFMLIVFLALTFIIGATNILNLVNMDRTTSATLKFIAETEGEFNGSIPGSLLPEAISDIRDYSENAFKTRYFHVVFDKYAQNAEVVRNYIAAVKDDTAIEYAKQAINESNNPGYYKSVYKYIVSKSSDNEKINVIFLDIGQEISSCASFIKISIVVAYFTLFIFFILVELLTDRMLKPIFDNNRKQKQFITDAGHELKTPLAIISANADVLELTIGKNEWIDSIHHQTERMSDLVKNLLLLAKAEESPELKEFNDFNYSAVVESVCRDFELVASKNNKELTSRIEPDIMFYGNINNIEQLVTLLTDNAVKYCDAGGNIEIRLFKKNKTIILETENTVSEDYSFDSDRLFDRFYRSDHSRSRDTGGYGIGLSLAQAIVNLHKGTIKAEKKDKSVCFCVTFKNEHKSKEVH